MKIRLISDVHHEFYEDEALYQNKGEDVLVIAGDLHVGHQNVLSSLRKFGNVPIIYTPGNHEYYRTSIKEFDYHLRAFTRDTNIHFLNPGFTKIADVTFIGATLWTNFRNDAIAKMVSDRNISDFWRIHRFSTDECVALHTEHFKFISEAYNKLPGKKVIVTHFLPAIECISEQFKGPDLLNYYFANDHADFIQNISTTWLFGHTHDNIDITINDTRLIANPYGYNKNNNYKEMIINV